MKIQVARIDENGLYLEPVLVEQNSPQNEIYQDVLDDNGNVIDRKLRSDIVLDNVPQGLHNPKWNGTEWIEGKVEAEILEQGKQSKIAELSNRCKQSIMYGFVASNGNGYRLTVEDQLNLQGQKSALDDDSTITSVDWLTMDDNSVTHTRDEWLTVYKEAFTHKDNAIWKNKNLREQVKAATTINEVESVVW